MSLLCELGWHRPRGIPRWNDGYYFAKCERCDRDLVRTAFGDWSVPTGYRVVWQPKPPADRPEVALEPLEAFNEPVDSMPVATPEIDPPTAAEDAAAVEAPGEAGAAPPLEPEEPVIDEAPTAEEDLPVAAAALEAPAEKPVPPESAAPAAPRRGAYWDFMDDHHHDQRPPLAGEAAGGRVASPGEWGAAEAQERGEGAPSLPGFFTGLWPKPPAQEALEASEPRAWHPGGFMLFTGSALIVVLAIVALIYGPMPSRDLPIAPADPTETSPFDATGDPPAGIAAPEVEPAQAYVTASVLSCRTAPARQAERVRNLARGARVRVLATEGQWVSVSHRGRQCWALARYVSPAEPL